MTLTEIEAHRTTFVSSVTGKRIRWHEWPDEAYFIPNGSRAENRFGGHFYRLKDGYEEYQYFHIGNGLDDDFGWTVINETPWTSLDYKQVFTEVIQGSGVSL